MEPHDAPPATSRRRLRITKLEIAAGGLVGIVLAILIALKPDILEAPFASTRASLAFFGGTLLALTVLGLMIWFGVHPIVRVLVVGVPMIAVSWWLIEPYFVDEVVNDEFASSIGEQRPFVASGVGNPDTATTATTSAGSVTVGSTLTPNTSAPRATIPGTTSRGTATPPPTSPPTTSPRPKLIGSGTLVGLAGHEGTGDAGIFRRLDGSLVLRLENLDIDNGPDLELYLVPGRKAYSPRNGSLHFGGLRGNVGNQTYEIPADYAVTPGPWTVLVWCEAFSVEFVAATFDVA